MQKKNMILDVDTGIDDALAIMLALKSDCVTVQGITTDSGNVSLEQATENTLRVIEMCGAHVPVVMGAANPLYRKWGGARASSHGANGIGDYKLPKSKQKPLAGNAADFIVQKVNENSGKLTTLVCLGRLTNMALALKKDAAISSRIERLVIMGGAYNVPGNASLKAENNMFGDPEAAEMVFSSGMPITMVGLDVTLKALFRQEHLDRMMELASSNQLALLSFVEHLLTFRLNAYRERTGIVAAPMHDPLAVAVAIDPTLVDMENVKMMVETEDELALGETRPFVEEDRGESLREALATTSRGVSSVCTGVDAERFCRNFIHTITNKR